MHNGLSASQISLQEVFRSFVQEDIAPIARRLDDEDYDPRAVVELLASHGFLGATVPVERGGRGFDMVTTGLLLYEVARFSAAVASLLTVHYMVTHAVLRFGTQPQMEELFPALADGTDFAAFALTEPGAGSDASAILTSAERVGDGYRVSGEKKWITGGTVADRVLISARTDGGPAMLLVPTDIEGMTRLPLKGMLGQRGAGLGELHLEGCRVPEERRIGGEGSGIRFVAQSALDVGRYCVAWASTGIAQACLDASLRYAEERESFGVPIKDHQLIRRRLTDMMADVSAAKLMCLRAGTLRDAGDPGSLANSSIAKYVASRVANRAADHAVQIHGASGCSPEHDVERFYRDARIMEIIEGSTEIQQSILPGMSPSMVF